MTSYVYAIASERQWAVKIGVSCNLKQRMAGIQSGNPERLVLVGAVEGSFGLEARVHEYLRKADHRIRGEWYICHTNVACDLLAAFRWGAREDVEKVMGRERCKSPLEPTTPLELFLCAEELPTCSLTDG